MFSAPTEVEITTNMAVASAGCGHAVLTARAYNELLHAARQWDALCTGSARGAVQQVGPGAAIRWEPQPDGSLRLVPA